MTGPARPVSGPTPDTFRQRTAANANATAACGQVATVFAFLAVRCVLGLLPQSATEKGRKEVVALPPPPRRDQYERARKKQTLIISFQR